MTLKPHRWRLAALLAATACTFAVGACSGSASQSSNTGGGSGDLRGPAAAAPGVDSAKGAGGAAVDPAQNSGGDTQNPAIQPDDRSVIYTGSITVKVNDVVKAANDATALVTALSGYVGADTRNLDADRSTASLVFRVPSPKFNATLDALSKLGNEESRSIQADDVTDSIIDLDARLQTQQASVDRVRALLAKAQSISDIVSIESELARREADLDSLKQRRAKLGGLVELSTITLNVHGSAATPPPPAPAPTGFLAGLKAGWSGFLVSVKGVLTVAGYLLPWLVAIGVPAWIIIALVRRSRRRALSAAIAAATPTAPLPPTPPTTPTDPSS